MTVHPAEVLGAFVSVWSKQQHQDADRRERLGGGTRGESTALPRGNPAGFLEIIAQRPQIKRSFL